MILPANFFDQDAIKVAKQLLGKVIRAKHNNIWLSATIIETEAYYTNDKASHGSLGYTEKRRALFMPPGTIYMYYARGKDSLNISVQGEGNAVLIKSAILFIDANTPKKMLSVMQQLNPMQNSNIPRPPEKLCAGQTLLCKSLGLTVKRWNAKQFDCKKFYIDDVGYRPQKIIQTTRLGIPKGRDEDLPYRFIDYDKARYCTYNPLTRDCNVLILNNSKGHF
jgi:DNA-3-methyladenine glycosylase